MTRYNLIRLTLDAVAGYAAAFATAWMTPFDVIAHARPAPSMKRSGDALF